MVLTGEADDICCERHKPPFRWNLDVVSVTKGFDVVDWYLASKLIKYDCPLTVVIIKPELSPKLEGHGDRVDVRVS